MNTRERRLSIALLAFIVVVGFGFFGYQFVLAPLKAKDAQISSLDGEIQDRTARVARIQKRRPDLDKWKKISLPPDAMDPSKAAELAAPVKPGATTDTARADLARREYEEELSKMLRASKFDAGSFSIIPKAPDAKTTPQLANKKPIYTKLVFTVQIPKGDLASLVDFLERFYKLRLLHQIRTMSIQKPIGSDRGGSNDLDINMTVEALVLDTAEQRKTLLPEKTPDLPSILARDNKQYDMIAGKNMFFGPPAPPAERKDPSVDVTPFVRLDGISSTPDGFVATLWDEYHNRDYKITPRSLGGYRVESAFTLNNRKRSDGERRDLALVNAQGEVELMWQVVRVDPRELILKDEDSHYALHLGQTLADMKPMTKTDLAARGIKTETPKETPKSEPK